MTSNGIDTFQLTNHLETQRVCVGYIRDAFVAIDAEIRSNEQQSPVISQQVRYGLGALLKLSLSMEAIGKEVNSFLSVLSEMQQPTAATISSLPEKSATVPIIPISAGSTARKPSPNSADAMGSMSNRGDSTTPPIHQRKFKESTGSSTPALDPRAEKQLQRENFSCRLRESLRSTNNISDLQAMLALVNSDDYTYERELILSKIRKLSEQ